MSAMTEKDFPIQLRFVFKLSFFILLFFVPFFLFIGRSPRNEIIYLNLLIVNLLFNVLQRHFFSFSFGEYFCDLKQGVLKKQERHLPYVRIQNIILDRDIIDRIFGITALIIETASGEQEDESGRKQSLLVDRTMQIGFSGNRVTIPGLRPAQAEELRNFLLKKIKEHPHEGL